MTVKRKVVVAAAAIHLALAAVYAGHVPAEVFLPRQLDRSIGIYGSVSGVRHHFDFFAPSVSTQARVDFRIFGADGSVRQVNLATPSAEVNNRIALMLTFYSYADTRENLLREWARFMLRHHPQAVAVESRIEALEIPPLAQIGKGAQARWVELGRATVRREKSLRVDRWPRALLSEADSFKPLAVMRMMVGAVLLVQAYVLWKYRDILLNPEGPLPWAITDTWVDPLLPKLSDLLPAFAALGVGPGAAIATVLGLHAVAAAFFMVGYRTRVATVVAWATFVLIKNSSLPYMYGVGAMLLIALFYSLFMPLGREWSIDRVLKPREAPEPTGDASLCVLMFRLHMCIIYAAAGFSKVVGEQWWSGDALWRALTLPQFRQFDPTPLAQWPGLLVAASMVAIFSQLLYPVLVWTRLRAVIVVLTELMHLGIAVLLGLWLFSLAMIALNTAAFGEAVWTALSGRNRRAAAGTRTESLRVVYDGACPFCDDYVRYQRLQAATGRLELVDARSRPEVLAEHGISPTHLEDGMVVIADGRQYHGADAVHLLSNLSEAPQKAWVRAVAALGRSRPVARLAYPFMRLGRRIALAFLGVPRFPRG